MRALLCLFALGLIIDQVERRRLDFQMGANYLQQFREVLAGASLPHDEAALPDSALHAELEAVRSFLSHSAGLKDADGGSAADR